MMARPGRFLRRAKAFLRDTAGQFAIMTAIMTPVAITLAAFAVDAGSLYLEKRTAQGMADLAAITAAANLDKAERAALLAMADNGVSAVASNGQGQFLPGVQGDQIVVLPGQYRADGQQQAHRRFVANATPHNAVKVTYKTTGTRYFAGALIPPPAIVVEAIAESSSAAAFSIGSRLLAVKEEGLLNSLLGGLLGSRVTLSVMDYRALLDADVRLLSFLDALAVETALTAGSYSQVLDAEVTLGQVGKALANSDGLSGTAKAAAGKLAQQAGGQNAPRLAVSRLIDPGGQLLHATIDRLGIELNALEVLTASAVVAGKGRQVKLDLGASVPPLLSTSAWLAIGEPPQHSSWFAIGSGGELVRTAQTRLALQTEIGGLLGANIRIPLYLELAFAEARLKSVACPSGRPESVRVAVEARPGAANLYLAEVDPSKIAGFANPAARSPATLLHVPLLVGVTAQAQAEIANTGYKPLTFTWNDIAGGRTKQVSTSQLTGSLTRSLLSSLDLKVTSLGGLLNVGVPPNLTAAVGQLVSAATPALDTVLDRVLTTLGVALGEADVRVYSADCGRSVLVQ